MVPVNSDAQRANVEAVADLIQAEVNVKEVEILDDASGILVKKIKPNFKVLGPKYGKDMKLVAGAVSGFGQEQIAEIESKGQITLEIAEKSVTLHLSDVEISSEDIEGWLVASSGKNDSSPGCHYR